MYPPTTATRGDQHDYLGMNFDFSEKGKVRIDLCKYIGNMVDEVSVPLREQDVAHKFEVRSAVR